MHRVVDIGGDAAVGILHRGDLIILVVGIGRDAVLPVGDAMKVVILVVGIVYGGVIGVGDTRDIPHLVVEVRYRLAVRIRIAYDAVEGIVGAGDGTHAVADR